MLKELVRILGITLILSGTLLYFIPSSKSDTNLQEKNNELQNQIKTLETKLEKSNGELAKLQTLIEEGAHLENDIDDDSATAVEDDDSNDNKHTDPIPEQITKLILEIQSGSTSIEVASKLEEAGIIEDANDFQNYLNEQDLMTKIQIGNHHIDSTMSIETIAKLITTRK